MALSPASHCSGNELWPSSAIGNRNPTGLTAANRMVVSKFQADFGPMLEPALFQVLAGALAVDDEEATPRIKHQQWVVPDIAGVVDALLARGQEGVQRL